MPPIFNDRMPEMPLIDEFICATLRGERPHWPESDGAAARFMERSAYHGVQALLHQHMGAGQGAKLGWPEAILEACRQQAIAQAMWEMRHEHLLKQVLARLSAIGVRPILFKGSALAYGLYAAPFLRTRGDSDFIVPPQDCGRAAAALEALGFERGQGPSGEFISYQACYSRSEPGGTLHALDLHWRINNSELLSKLFAYEELRQQAQALPELGTDAIAAGPVHALMLACMHRTSHKHHPYHVDGTAYYGGDRLIWLYDIHLLLEALSPLQQGELAELAQRKGLRAVCLEGIELARARFHTRVPDALREALASIGPAEPMADYLGGTALYQQWADFQAIGGTRNKLRFMAEVLFPPASYMRQKYPHADQRLLPWLYLRRAGAGIWSRVRSSHRGGEIR